MECQSAPPLLEACPWAPVKRRDCQCHQLHWQMPGIAGYFLQAENQAENARNATGVDIVSARSPGKMLPEQPAVHGRDGPAVPCHWRARTARPEPTDKKRHRHSFK
jgi:hypothetical protein